MDSIYCHRLQRKRFARPSSTAISFLYFQHTPCIICLRIEFTSKRSVVDKHIFGRFVVEQHGIFLDAVFDGQSRFPNLVRQPSQATGDYAECNGLGQETDAFVVLRHVPRQPGQRSSQLAERHAPVPDGHRHAHCGPTNTRDGRPTTPVAAVINTTSSAAADDVLTSIDRSPTTVMLLLTPSPLTAAKQYRT